MLEVADLLRSRIHGGELAPGDRLPAERDFALELGVARPTLRQALKILQDEGYLETRRGATGGTFVSELQAPLEQWSRQLRENIAEFDDIIGFRQAVETHAARLAAMRRDEDDLERMNAAASLMLTADSRAIFRQADSLFHNALGRASRSPRLQEAIRRARGEFFFPTDRLCYEEQITLSHRDHVAILAAIRDGDPEEAARQMSIHLENARQELHRIVSRIKRQ